MSSKAQISAEFMILAAIALIFFGLLLYSYVQTSSQARLLQEEDSALASAKTISSAIDLVYLSPPGESRLVYLPSNNYNVSIDSSLHLVEIYWNGGYVSYPVRAVVSSVVLNSSNITILRTSSGVSIS